MFAFLDEGIKDIVLEAVKEVSYFKRKQNQETYLNSKNVAAFHGGVSNPLCYVSPMTQNIIRSYYNFVNEGSGSSGQLSHDHSVNVGVIEVVSTAIEEAVSDLIIGLVGTPNVEIKLDWYPWVGNDLAVEVRLLNFTRNRDYD